MRVEWLPFSASALVAGGVSLAASSFLMPDTGSSGDALKLAGEEDARWLAVSVLFFVASVLLTLGLPAVLTLVSQRTARLGLGALGLFAVGCIGTAGYAMLLVFFHALADNHAIRSASLDAVIEDNGLATFLYGWIVAFYLGELLLAITLLRAGTVARWIPLLMIVHTLTLPLGFLLPDQVSSAAVLLLTVAVAGLGIAANNRHLATPA